MSIELLRIIAKPAVGLVQWVTALVSSRRSARIQEERARVARLKSLTGRIADIATALAEWEHSDDSLFRDHHRRRAKTRLQSFERFLITEGEYELPPDLQRALVDAKTDLMDYATGIPRGHGGRRTLGSMVNHHLAIVTDFVKAELGHRRRR